MLALGKMLAPCICLISSPALAVENEQFIYALSTIQESRSVFYNCQIEVAKEQMNPVCSDACESRLFLRAVRRGRSDLLFTEIFNDRKPSKDEMKLREWHYLAEFKHVNGRPRIAGVLTTGADGRVMFLRLKFTQPEGDDFLVCRGVDTRRLAVGIDR